MHFLGTKLSKKNLSSKKIFFMLHKFVYVSLEHSYGSMVLSNARLPLSLYVWQSPITHLSTLAVLAGYQLFEQLC